MGQLSNVGLDWSYSCRCRNPFLESGSASQTSFSQLAKPAAIQQCSSQQFSQLVGLKYILEQKVVLVLGGGGFIIKKIEEEAQKDCLFLRWNFVVEDNITKYFAKLLGPLRYHCWCLCRSSWKNLCVSLGTFFVLSMAR